MVKIKAYLGRQMLKQCKGEPWAVRILGGVLRNKETIVQWVTVRKTLKSYLKGDRKEERASMGLIAFLELSYNDLPFYLKPCFLYLGNFPEDFEISAERLYHLWEAEGLLTVLEDNGYEIQEGPIDYNTAESYLNQLVGRCLVEVCERWENGKIKSCRLHDIILDICLQKCEQLKFLSIIKPGRSDQPSSQILSRYILNRKWHRCALHLGGTTSDAHLPLDPSSSNAPSIRSLLVFPNSQDRGPKGLFSSNKSTFFSRIRILDLEGTAIPMDPKKSQEFIHLRYLSFKGAKFISSLPTNIWNCKFLETLDLRWDTDAKLLISNKFCKLERLRHLYLPYQMKLEGSRWMIFTEKQLQQLGTLENFNVDICRAEDLSRMTSLRVFTFANVVVLSMHCVKLLQDSPMIRGNRLVNSLNLSVQPHVINEKDSLRTLSRGVHIAGLDISGRIDAAANLEIFREFRLQELCLSGSEIDMEGISVIEELSHLVKLTLKGDAIAGTSMKFSAGGFPRLKRLSLLDLSELENWVIEEGALPSLESLDITRCRKLKMIPAVLPEQVTVTCTDPCVRGVERYNICPYSCALMRTS